MGTTDLARLLARRLFMAGDEPGQPATRMQYMSGTWPDKERPQGGMCEMAVMSLFKTVLDEVNREAAVTEGEHR